jgi:hypothetical protein
MAEPPGPSARSSVNGRGWIFIAIYLNDGNVGRVTYHQSIALTPPLEPLLGASCLLENP